MSLSLIDNNSEKEKEEDTSLDKTQDMEEANVLDEKDDSDSADELKFEKIPLPIPIVKSASECSGWKKSVVSSSNYSTRSTFSESPYAQIQHNKEVIKHLFKCKQKDKNFQMQEKRMNKEKENNWNVLSSESKLFYFKRKMFKRQSCFSEDKCPPSPWTSSLDSQKSTPQGFNQSFIDSLNLEKKSVRDSVVMKKLEMVKIRRGRLEEVKEREMYEMFEVYEKRKKSAERRRLTPTQLRRITRNVQLEVKRMIEQNQNQSDPEKKTEKT